jgi:chromosome segregation protein
MYLKKLELTGFKSFAEKTELSLGPGMNAVVGPNGSGKSNIADALRWVMGEMSAKQLRGGKMEDIIFAGTAHRKPLGYADITMRVDNSCGTLPLATSEVAVTRRVYRSGETEYLINGEGCRLKDIQHLFMDTGVGRDGISIIGQGRVDSVLSAKSEERRAVFEEAAGIAKFKSRRTEAMQKLSRERDNRTRVDDIIFELSEQIEPLEAQAQEATRYLALRDRYKDIHINIFLSEVRKIAIEQEQATTSLEHIRTQTESGRRLLNEARTAGEELKARSAAADVAYRRASETVLDISTRLEQKQGVINLLKSKIEQHEAEITRLESESTRREAAHTAKSLELAAEREAHDTATLALAELEAELAAHMAASTALEAIIAEENAEVARLTGEIMACMTAVTDARALVLEHEASYARLEDDKEELAASLENHEEKLHAEEAALQAATEQQAACAAALSRAKDAEAALLSAYETLKAEHEAHETELRAVSENLTAVRGRYRALEALEANTEGYYRSVKAVLARKMPGICGAVGQLIGVDEQYATAIEIALGSAAQNIITNTENDAKHAIEYLKQSREGRATFLPLSAVKPRETDMRRLQNEPGYIGAAHTLATCDARYAPAISQLLGDIVIVETLDDALAMHRKFKYSYKIVTLAGERLSPGGAITGGSMAQKAHGIIGRAKQLSELRAQMQVIESEHAQLSAAFAQLSQKRQATREALNRAHDHTSALLVDEKTAAAAVERTAANVAALAQMASHYNEENDAIMARIVETNGLVRAAKTALAACEDAHAAAGEQLAAYRREAESKRASQTEETGEITELRVKISAKREWLAHSARDIARLEGEAATLLQEQNLLAKEAASNRAAMEQAQKDFDAISQELGGHGARLAEAKEALTAGEAEKARLDGAIAGADADDRTRADEVSLMERELTRLEMRLEQLEATSQRLHAEIWEEYELTPAAAEAFKRTDISDAAMRREGQELRRELAQMTDVNVGAIEAFKQLTTRHGFLSTQREDILAAEAQLDEIIANLTAQMETQFVAQFDIIAGQFSDVFREMFDGGKASISLTEAASVLEAGIEITAQPPGKTLQSLSLLSGGERALTAIALLFAILRAKPSPFCVLDEIESALDDANVIRFSKFMRAHTHGTQFIVITHRKGTMEAADNLYGVTMQEQGISKLVSVRLIDSSDSSDLSRSGSASASPEGNLKHAAGL